MDRVFLIAAIVVIPAFVLSFFLKEVKLRTESGLQAQAAERAAAERLAAEREQITAEGFVG
jgi:cell division protein FtsB